MKLGDPVKLVSQLLDLPILDKDERWCGIVDDVELEGGPGKPTRVTALLVGPGAYEGRMPGFAFRLVRAVAGGRIVRVPVSEIVNIASSVKLNCKAEAAGLHRTEDRVRAWIPRWGAL
jgi:sporulation protein YlmC with PRC-barrel domain